MSDETLPKELASALHQGVNFAALNEWARRSLSRRMEMLTINQSETDTAALRGECTMLRTLLRLQTTVENTLGINRSA